MGSNYIKHGDIAVISSDIDNPILIDSESYKYNVHGNEFDQGWGRWCQSDSTLYGNMHLDEFNGDFKTFL